MSTLRRDTELEKKVAEGIIKFVRAKEVIDSIITDRLFVEKKLSKEFYESLIQSKNAISDFLDDICEKLDCTILDLNEICSEHKEVAEITQDDIIKLVEFMSSRSVAWFHILVGLGVAAASVGIAITSGGVSAPLMLSLIGCGSGIATTILSITIARLADDLSAFITKSRFDDIQRAHNLHKQFQEYGEYPTAMKFRKSIEDFFENISKRWNWGAVRT